MAYRITGKKLEGNFLGAPTTSCKPKDYPTKERITIDGIKWEPKTFEELVGMGFIPDEGTSGLIRYDGDGTLWSAMVVDGCCSCTIQSDSWGWLDDAFGETLEEAIRAMVAKHGATYKDISSEPYMAKLPEVLRSWLEETDQFRHGALSNGHILAESEWLLWKAEYEAMEATAYERRALRKVIERLKGMGVAAKHDFEL